MKFNLGEENVFVLIRLWTFQLSDLAVELARQAGKEPTRPLSEDQLRRAWEVHQVERERAGSLLLKHWEELERQASDEEAERPNPPIAG